MGQLQRLIPSPQALNGHLVGEQPESTIPEEALTRLIEIVRASQDPAYLGSPEEQQLLSTHRFLTSAYTLAHRRYLLGDAAPLASLLQAHGLEQLSEVAAGRTVESRDVTVYVPCYNGAHFLPTTLAALRAQSYPITRLLVIDDGSSDDSAAVARAYGAEVISHPQNKGLAAARNTALELTRTEFIGCVDADTAPHPLWLERLMEVVQSGAGIAAGGRLIERYSASLPNRWRSRIMAQHGGRLPASDLTLFGCNSVGRAEELRAVGGYSEQFRQSFEDVDFTRRFIASGRHTYYHPDALCWHGRTDTLQSVLATAYGWRNPPFVEKGCHRDLAALGAKWSSTVRGDIGEISTLLAEGRGDLSIISFLHTVMSIATDIFRFEGLSSEQRAPFRSFGLRLLAYAVGTSEGLRTAVKQAAAELLRALCARNDATEIAERCHAEIFAPTVGCVATRNQHWRGELTSQLASLLEITLGELGAVLNFPSDIQAALEAGALRLARDGDTTPLTLPFPASCYLSKTSGPASADTLSEFEWLEMLSGISQEQVQLKLSDVDEVAAAGMALRLVERAPQRQLAVQPSAVHPLLRSALSLAGGR